ncbi:MAG: hypothetical protein M3362_01855 [Acidobacteriota bacterium]|nr:hypothetical protein [Acidobacteriota bacterium]
MNYKAALKPIILLACILAIYSPAAAQLSSDQKAAADAAKKECTAPSNISTWLNCKVDEISAAKLQQRDPIKLVQVPSIAENTTSLVDTSEAPDVLGIALQLAGLSTGDKGKEKTTPISFTTTAYALYAAATQRDPLNPAVYVRHPNLRRFSFSFGQETPEDDNGDKATLLGTKVLIINRRDASLPTNRALLRPVSMQLRRANRDFARTTGEVEDYLYSQLWQKLNLPDPETLDTEDRRSDAMLKFINEHLGTGQMTATLGLLSEEQLSRIDEIITSRIDSRVNLDEANRRVIEEIRRAPQLAFTTQSKLRKGNGTDEYRAALTFDYGLYRRINLTLNAGFDYLDSKKVGGDMRGGRVAGETFFQLTPDRRVFTGAGPWLFSVSGEGKWLTNSKPTYTGQLKLTIPVLDGVDFPLSVSFANRSDLIKESHVRGRFGFSFDIPKLVSALHK